MASKKPDRFEDIRRKDGWYFHLGGKDYGPWKLRRQAWRSFSAMIKLRKEKARKPLPVPKQGRTLIRVGSLGIARIVTGADVPPSKVKAKPPRMNRLSDLPILLPDPPLEVVRQPPPSPQKPSVDRDAVIASRQARYTSRPTLGELEMLTKLRGRRAIPK